MATKCTMTGCGHPPTRRVAISVPGDVAEGGAVDTGALADIAELPACDEHAEHIAKVFYGAAYALSGTVTTSPLGGGGSGAAGRGAASTRFGGGGMEEAPPA